MTTSADIFLASPAGEVASADCAEVGGVKLNPSNFLQNPSVSFADSVSLRLGHVAALTVHRTVIHYRADTALPYKGAHAQLYFLPDIHYRRAASLPCFKGRLEKLLLDFKFKYEIYVTFQPPLIVRGGVERSETEGLKGAVKK